eukprot:snap_masked-scaffold_50-processed-gene-1.37-mRNA-1 protein AED:1.00 eAED:1.00 QI:0/0/0/0/1/1/3/0/125
MFHLNRINIDQFVELLKSGLLENLVRFQVECREPNGAFMKSFYNFFSISRNVIDLQLSEVDPSHINYLVSGFLFNIESRKNPCVFQVSCKDNDQYDFSKRYQYFATKHKLSCYFSRQSCYFAKNT